MAEHYPLYEIIHRHYHRELGRFPDLVHCPDFNDKIQWLKLFDQDERMIQCSDKLGVREFVAEKVGEKYLVPLLQKANTFDEIDFNALPKSFVLKTNHDSGTVILVRDKSKFDMPTARERIDRALSGTYGWDKGEWSYACYAPGVLVEAFIDPEMLTAPPDYKFQCVNGQVKFCRYTYDRDAVGKEVVVDRNGTAYSFIIDEHFLPGGAFQRPDSWSEMLRLCEALSADFKCVRVDLYLSLAGHLYVGELTFWPMAGCYHGEGQRILGKELDFDRSSVKEPIYLRCSRSDGCNPYRDWA